MTETTDLRWRERYRIGGATELIAAAMIPISIAAFIIYRKSSSFLYPKPWTLQRLRK